MQTKTVTIKPRDLKTRDYALVALINGATKSGAHKDRRKERNRKACRKPVRGED